MYKNGIEKGVSTNNFPNILFYFSSTLSTFHHFSLENREVFVASEKHSYSKLANSNEGEP